MAEVHGLLGTVDHLHFDQHVGQTHDAESDLPPVGDGLPLLLQGVEGEALVEDVVERPDADPHGLLEVLFVEDPVLDEGGEVHAAEETAASGGEGLLGAGVGAGVFVVGELREEVPLADPVPVQAAGLPIVPVGVA